MEYFGHHHPLRASSFKLYNNSSSLSITIHPVSQGKQRTDEYIGENIQINNMDDLVKLYDMMFTLDKGSQ